MAGMADGMAVWQTEWSNGGNGGNGQTAERMAEWHNGRMAGMADGIHIDDLIVVFAAVITYRCYYEC